MFLHNHIKEQDAIRAELEAQVEAFLTQGGTITQADQPEPRPAKTMKDLSESMFRARDQVLKQHGKRIMQEYTAGRGVKSIAYDLRVSHPIVSWCLSQLKAQAVKPSDENAESAILAEIAQADGVVSPRDIAKALRQRGLKVTYSDVDRVAALHGYGDRIEA